jgi:hypothetical protein
LGKKSHNFKEKKCPFGSTQAKKAGMEASGSSAVVFSGRLFPQRAAGTIIPLLSQLAMFTECTRFSCPTGPFDQGRFFGRGQIFDPTRPVFPGYGCCKKTVCGPLPSVALRCLDASVPWFYGPSNVNVSESSWLGCISSGAPLYRRWHPIWCDEAIRNLSVRPALFLLGHSQRYENIVPSPIIQKINQLI